MFLIIFNVYNKKVNVDTNLNIIVCKTTIYNCTKRQEIILIFSNLLRKRI